MSKKGEKLRHELNDAFERIGSDARIPGTAIEDCSRLMRHVTTYARRAEEACCYEWASGDKWDVEDARIEALIARIAKRIPHVVDMRFDGDPRGFVVRLQTDPEIHNTWGRDGWGIA